MGECRSGGGRLFVSRDRRACVIARELANNVAVGSLSESLVTYICVLSVSG